MADAEAMPLALRHELPSYGTVLFTTINMGEWRFQVRDPTDRCVVTALPNSSAGLLWFI